MRINSIRGMLAAATLLSAPAAAQPPANFAAAVNACIRAQHAATPFSGIVVAALGSERTVAIEGTTDGSQAHSAGQRYRLASVGKVLTQVAIARLVQQGRIRLDAPASTYLPDLPTAIGAVTIEQLLQHRSGVASMGTLTRRTVETQRSARTARELLPLIVDQPLAFIPGSQSEYSNGGYFLLGAIIEAVSGMSYAEFLQREIFAPLGMSASSALGEDGAAPSMTRLTGPGQPMRAQPGPTLFPDLPGSPAGDSVSTADDLMRLAQALNGHDFLSDAAKAAVFPRRGAAWGIGQAGGRPGANAYFMAFPELGASLVVLTNYDPPAGELMGMVLARLIARGACQPITPDQMPEGMRPPPGPPPRNGSPTG